MPRHATETSFKKGQGLQDHSGERYGRWLVLVYLDTKVFPSGRRASIYLCRCDCGTEREVAIDGLLNGHSKSCGCLSAELKRLPRLKEGQGIFRRFFRNLVSSAQRRGLGWALTEDDVISLIGQPCHYCKAIPSQICRQPKNERREWHIPLVYNGIDRRNNNVGYTPENSLPCCKICNFMKGGMGYEAFLAHVAKIVGGR